MTHFEQIVEGFVNFSNSTSESSKLVNMHTEQDAISFHYASLHTAGQAKNKGGTTIRSITTLNHLER
jgi:hypothetical protein